MLTKGTFRRWRNRRKSWYDKHQGCQRRRPPALELLEHRLLLAESSATDHLSVASAWFAVVPQVYAGPEAILAGSPVESVLAGQSASGTAAAPSRWMVRLTDAATEQIAAVAEVESLLDALICDFQVLRGLGQPGQVLVRALGPPDQARAALAGNPLVRSFEADARVFVPQAVPNDPLFPEQIGLDNTGQAGGLVDADIDAPQAWDTARDSSSVVVGLVDSGVDYTHPDLYLNVWMNPGEIPASLRAAWTDVDGDGTLTLRDLNASANVGLVSDVNHTGYLDAGDILADSRWADGQDTDGNSYVDDLFGWDFVHNDNMPYDEHRHGTHVAGIMAAMGDNGLGVTGVSWSASVLPLRFLDAANEGATSDAVTAINYATLLRSQQQADVRVLNASWGGATYSPLLDAAVELSGERGILLVAAAGNGDVLGRGVDLESQPFYPASLDHDNVISVAACDPQDQLARFSNYGRRSVDLAAPGVGNWSTEPQGAYQRRNGTSMAAPLVTGAVALAWAHSPEASPAQIKQAVLASVDPLPQLQNVVASGGRLNVVRALEFDPLAPTATLGAVPKVSQAGAGSYAFSVTYRDGRAIQVASLDDADIVVSRSGGEVFSAGAKLVSVDQPADGSPRVVTYQIAPPGGAWDFADNGTFRITLRPNQVRDTGGNAAAGVWLGSFQVDIPEPPTAGVLRVTSTEDGADADLGDGENTDAQGRSTLRASIQEANAAPGDTRILVPAGTYTLNLDGADEDAAASGDLDLTGHMEIVGAGADLTIIEGAGLDRVFQIAAGASVTLRGLTLCGGSVAGDGGGVLNAGTLTLVDTVVRDNAARDGGAGGGIANIGSLRLSGVRVIDNSAARGAGGIHSAAPGTTPSLSLTDSVVARNVGGDAGGVVNDGPLFLVGSTIADNMADGPGGGETGMAGGLVNGLFNAAAAVAGEIVRSTISGNRTNGRAGGVWNSGTLSLTNSTISGNLGGATGGIDSGAGPLALLHVTVTDNAGEQTGGVDAVGASVQNSIIAGNRAAGGVQPDVSLGPFASLGNNLIGIEAGSANFGPATNGDRAGTLDQPLDPLLAPLDAWGGSTKTHALRAGSPAIGAAAFTGLSEDQRGAERVLGGPEFGAEPAPDIGAFEFGTFFVDDLKDATDAQVGDGLAVDTAGRRTLRAAVQEANAAYGRNVIVLGPGRFAIEIPGREEDLAEAGDLDVRDALSLVGAGPRATVVDGRQLDRVLHVQQASIELSGLRVTGGLAEGDGGGIDVQGSAWLRQVEVVDNAAAGSGGGMSVSGWGQSLRLEDSDVSRNRAGGSGGGIYTCYMRVELGNSRVTDNDAGTGGGLYVTTDDGSGGASAVTGSQISGNRASWAGGGLYLVGYGGTFAVSAASVEENRAETGSGGGIWFQDESATRLEISDTLIAANSSWETGGGLSGYSSDFIFLTDSTVSANRAGGAGGRGGGISLGYSTAALSHVTVTQNRAESVSGLCVDLGGTVTLANSILAGNAEAQAGYQARDVWNYPGTLVSAGGNLIGDASSADLVSGPGDLLGTALAVVDPRLGPLQDNGGPTRTHALRSGSPAIDAALDVAAAADQRGATRPLDGDNDGVAQPDIGAFELEYGLPIRVDGAAFDDRDGDGVQGSGEARLANWTVFADANANGKLDFGEATAVTDERGEYEFEGLEPGTYLIGEVPRPNWERVFPAAGRADLVPFGTLGGGDRVQAVVAADLDGDGDPDLATADFGGDSVSVVFQQGDGTWAAPVPLPVGAGPVDLVAADMDGDGDADLAAANFNSDTVTWLRNDGAGGFALGATLAVGDGPRAIVAADLNRDGNLDLLTADSLGNRISILRNGGDGQFAVAEGIAAGHAPQDIVAADLDGDGDTDTAVVNLEAFTATLLFNDDVGRLEFFADLPVGGFPRSVAAGDLDADGDVDLAVANSFSNTVSVLLNNGHGGFKAAAPDLESGRTPRAIEIRDVDHDARPDVVVVNSAENSVSLLVNQGGAEFASPRVLDVGSGPRAVAVADLDGDGNLDLVVANQDGDSLSVLRNTYGSHAIQLVAGDRVRQLDFGNRLVPGEIRGLVFHDLNADGTREGVEPGLSGWQVFLDANGNAQWDAGEQATQTAADGSYALTGLLPLQTYRVHEVVPAGWTQTAPAASAFLVDVEIGEVVGDVAFGNYGTPGEIRGVKFQDLDGDGSRDAEEPGAANGTVYVDLNGNGHWDGNEPSAVTDAQGEYVIRDLPPRDAYVVDAVPQTGWVPTAPAENLTFGDRRALPIADNVDHFAIGDLEGDGDHDLVISTGTYDRRLVALANNGQGKFTRKWNYTIASTPDYGVVALGSGDFNGDGFLDVATVESNQDESAPNRVAVYLNQGNQGVTRVMVRAGLAAQVSCLLVADLNNDALDDLLYGPTSALESEVQVLFGDGLGNFPPERQTTLRNVLGERFASAFFSGDFDGDGGLDLGTGLSHGMLGFFFHRGDDSFLPPAATDISLGGRWIDPSGVADLDQDGDLDIVMLRYSPTANGAGSIEVLRNRGDGTFELQPAVPVQPGADSYRLADVDADGDLDLVYRHAQEQEHFAYLRNSGTGVFVPGGTIVDGTVNSVLELADFNGDGRADAFTLTGPDRLPAVVLNTSRGPVQWVDLAAGQTVTGVDFGGVEASSLGGASTAGMTSGMVFNDLNGDGTRNGGEAALVGVTVFVDQNRNGRLDEDEPRQATQPDHPDTLSDETGSYEFADLLPGSYALAVVVPPGYALTSPRAVMFADQTFPTGDGPQAVAAADFDGDGDRDLAVANAETNNVSVLLNRGDATFGTPWNLPTGFGPTAVAAGDFDGDARPDLLAANRYSNSLSLLVAVPGGVWRPAVTVELAGSPSALAVADLDGDGDPDAAVALETQHQVQVLRNNGGTFAPWTTLHAGRSPLGIHAADIDGDGAVDLLTANFDSHNVSVLRNNGDGTFAAAANLGTGRGAFAVTTGDVDADGDLDILAANFLADDISLLRNRGRGVFPSAENYNAGRGPASLTAADFDGDGDLDLAIGNATSTNVSLLFNTGSGTFLPPADYGVANFPKSLAFAVQANDFDGDGDSDLALVNALANQVAVMRTDVVPGPHRFTLGTRQEVASLQFGLRAAPANTAPQVVQPVPDQNAVENLAWQFTVSAETFSDADADAGDWLTFTASLADGSPLPAWLQFAGSTRQFQGRAPFGPPPPLRLMVTATDTGGWSATAPFTLTVLENPHPQQNPTNVLDVDRSGSISANDALLAINFINRYGTIQPPRPTTPQGPEAYVDVDGNNLVTAGDVLQVINYLNSHPASGGSGEAEGGVVHAAPTSAAGHEALASPDTWTADPVADRWEELYDLLAEDQLGGDERRSDFNPFGTE